MTSATKTPDRARWEAKAIALAEEHHLIHRARYLGTGVYGESLWEIPSTSHLDGSYIVHIWPVTMGAVCSCLAASFSWACGHCGSAILAERQKQAAARGSGGSEGNTALRWFAHGGEW